MQNEHSLVLVTKTPATVVDGSDIHLLSGNYKLT